jgi:hypothetical protein
MAVWFCGAATTARLSVTSDDIAVADKDRPADGVGARVECSFDADFRTHARNIARRNGDAGLGVEFDLAPGLRHARRAVSMSAT